MSKILLNILHTEQIHLENFSIYVIYSILTMS